MSLVKKAVLYPTKIPQAARIELKTFGVILRYGLPDIMLEFLGGIGDELLLTIVAHELKKRNSKLKIWQVSHSVELLYYNPDYTRVFTWDYLPLRFSNLLNSRRCKIDGYARPIEHGEEYMPPKEHIVSIMCRKAGIKGQILLKPWIFLTQEEKEKGERFEGSMVVNYPGESSYAHMKNNKLWDIKRFEKVLEIIGSGGLDGQKHTIIQVGGLNDPLLKGVIDLRGKTTLRESAAILYFSEFFLGFVGFLMHLARAVDCRSIIIYGGLEHSWQSGYSCNENINSLIDCAPCWKLNYCDRNRECMNTIQVNEVLQAVEKLLKRKGTPIETDATNI